MSGRRNGAGLRGSERRGNSDRKPGLSRKVVVIFGAMVGSYIAGRVFDAVRKRR